MCCFCLQYVQQDKVYNNCTLYCVELKYSSIVIRDDPSDVTVFLDDTALFTCLIEVGYIKWRVNDTDSDDLTNAIQSDLATHNTSVSGLYLFALTIQGRVEYNRTRIQCVTRSQDNNLIHTSETALLSIQGIHT